MTPWKVFYSYSHKDRELRDRLGVYLAPLRQQQKIIEWFDRDIEPGTDWREKISERIDDANLILLLVSPDFLASDYCFQIEVEKAIARFKRGEVEIIPIYLKECLWEDTAFGALQSLPGNPILSLSSVEEGMMIVAKEIRNRVSKSPPNESGLTKKKSLPASLDLVREQTHAYARLYERTRQRMRASNERTVRMEQIFAKMRDLAGASYPLLSELTTSPSPGEKLAAIAILQVFSTSRHFPFLVSMVASEKPFVGYQAVRALRFAVGTVDPRVYLELQEAIVLSEAALNSASVGFDTGRQSLLRQARSELQANVQALVVPSPRFD